MSDNNPTPWPPTPSEAEPEPAKPPANNKAGMISLGLSACGLVLYMVPFLMTWTGSGNIGFAFVIVPFIIMIGIIFVMALVFGIVGLRSLPGKFGLALALVFLGYLAFQILDSHLMA